MLVFFDRQFLRSAMQGEPPRDFGGPFGNLLLIFGLPALTAYLYFGLAFNNQKLLPSTHSDWAGFCQAMMPTWETAAIVVAWLLLQATLHIFVPGSIRTGAEIPRGGRLSYKMNGLASLGISLLIVAAL